MDNRTEAEIRDALDACLKGRTTLAIAHRLSTVTHYDRILYMENGEIAESGRYDELVSRKGRFHSLVYGTAGKEG